MTVESATYISQLNSANPTGSDAKSEGDDHLRLLKATIRATFPNFGAAALNASNTQLDKVVTTISINASAPSGAATIDSAGRVSLGIAGSRDFNVTAQSGTTSALTVVANSFNGNPGSASLYLGNRSTDNKGGLTYDTQNGVMSVVSEGATRMLFDASGNVVKVLNTSAAALNNNSSMMFSLPSNTQLAISVRGSDGTTRTAIIPLS